MDRLPALVAPDSFKGTFTAAEVAAAIARGLRAAGQPADELPVADGGEGTQAALLGALGGESRRRRRRTTRSGARSRRRSRCWATAARRSSRSRRPAG